MKKFSSLFLMLTFFCSIILGCNNVNIITESVTGIVSLDGVPLSNAKINFSPKNPDEGSPAFATTNEKGEYKLQTLRGKPDAGTLPGEYAVTISKSKSVPTGKKIESMGEMVEAMESVPILPSIYRNVTETPFSVTVVKGKNSFDFDVKSNPSN
jgi:hypothetical protein